ncbi:nucleoside hydrolase [Maribacter sp. 2307ULW6-5]|uniref:nucleoside hydrolase n=1 Tax=Maribacter sp. 2307ULW6-5 TaxID=3386275 RepID=UPI0039BC4717
MRNPFVTLSFIVFLLMGLCGATAQTRVIVDADTGNEVDDLFALARILMEPGVDVIALNAAHWQTSHWTEPRSMENSHRLNQQLLGEMGLSVPTFRGAPARMYDWGDRAQHSAATYQIMERAGKLKNGEKLTILVLGALTNVASALFLKPELDKKLKVYWLGSTMDFNKGVLKRNDFNSLMDPFALDLMLESDTEMYVMPINVASALTIEREQMAQEIGMLPLGRFLMDRWQRHIDGGRKDRVLWDLGLIAAFLRPELAQTTVVKTSRDSGDRNITFYKQIDAKEIYQDFYQTLKASNTD